MQPADDSVLLRQYSEDHSEDAFAALVTRHVNLVYSVALRQAGNPHHAQEITQAVFVILAQKAAGLRHARALTSWLFQTTRLTAANFARSEARRHRREQEAFMQSKLDETGGEAWPAIAPLLDSAVAALSESERQAILLRYYEDRNLREVGQALGASEDAAEKRVSRALEKLRKFLARRGVSFTTTIIAGTLTAHSVQAAPAGLAQAVTAVAAAKGAAAGTSTLTLVKGVLKIMAWTKMKTAVLVGTGLLLAGGAITLGLTQTAADEKPTAGEILRQVQTHYDALTTLRDSGTSVLQTAGRQQAATFQVKFARPHRYAMTLGQGGHTANMWNANGHEYGLVDQKMYFQFADDVQNLQGVTGFNGAGGLSVAGFFYHAFGEAQTGEDEDAFITRLAAGKNTVRQRDEQVAGFDCYVITMPVPAFQVTLWIGQKDLLIHKRRLVSAPQPDPGDNVTFTEIHTNLVVNEPLTDDDLIPRIPAGVKLQAVPQH